MYIYVYIYIYMYIYMSVCVCVCVCVCTCASKKLTLLEVKSLVMLYKFYNFISSSIYVPSPTRKYNNVYTYI